MKQPTIDDMRAALEATKLPPKEGFDRLVKDGLVNAQGQLTKLFGGDAEPEPGAQRPPVLTSANCNGASAP